MYAVKAILPATRLSLGPGRRSLRPGATPQPDRHDHQFPVQSWCQWQLTASFHPPR